MARPVRKGPVERLTLDLPVPVRETLDRLKESTSATSLVEVVQRAILLYDVLGQMMDGNNRLLLVGTKGEREVILPEFYNRRQREDQS